MSVGKVPVRLGPRETTGQPHIAYGKPLASIVSSTN